MNQIVKLTLIIAVICALFYGLRAMNSGPLFVQTSPVQQCTNFQDTVIKESGILEAAREGEKHFVKNPPRFVHNDGTTSESYEPYVAKKVEIELDAIQARDYNRDIDLLTCYIEFHINRFEAASGKLASKDNPWFVDYTLQPDGKGNTNIRWTSPTLKQ